MMRMAVATVMYESNWEHEAADIGARLALLDEILEKARGADLVVLPAGFACVKSESAAQAAAAKMVGMARFRAAVAFGCDVKGPSKKSPAGKAKSRRLNNFGYLALRDGSHAIWHVRQLAATSSERVQIDDRRVARTVPINGKMVGLLICGEMMARRGGRGFAGQRVSTIVEEADVAIDIAHADIKTGRSMRTWSAALRELGAKRNRPAVMAQHLYADAVRNNVKSYADKEGPRRLVHALAPSMERARVVNGKTRADEVRAYVDFYDT